LLSFNTNLTTQLSKANTSCYWFLKLYNGDETGFTGLSDKSRTISSVYYPGLISSWGSLNFNLDPENFMANQNIWSITIINISNSIDGGRFSDLVNSKNYENRKWELYANDENLSDSDAEIIATGTISGDFKHDEKKITLRLQSLNAKYNSEVPNSSISQGSYQNAPPKNRGIAIPMLYGDFSIDTTYPAPLDQYVSSVKVPAIVVDQYNHSTGKVEIKPDTVALHTLYTKNLYHYNDGLYSACENTNVTVTASTPVIKFSGRDFFAYQPLTGQQAAIDREP